MATITRSGFIVPTGAPVTGNNIPPVRKIRPMSPGEAHYVENVRKQMKQVEKRLQLGIKAVENATPAAIIYALQPIFEKSQELVPIDTGDLKNSGYISARRSGIGADAEIGYGFQGHPTYAALVHEKTDMRHAKGKQAKYLETAINQHITAFLPRLKQFMANRLGFWQNRLD